MSSEPGNTPKTQRALVLQGGGALGAYEVGVLSVLCEQYALYNKGDTLISLGNYTGAITYLDKALAIDPKYESALYDKGRALNSLGNYKQAIQYFDEQKRRLKIAIIPQR